MTKYFSSSKARRLTLQGLLAAAAVGLGVTAVVTQIDPGNPVEAAQIEVQTQATELDLVAYSRVEAVRRRAGLENGDLAALGVTSTEASAVLTRLVQWCDTNEKAIASASQKVNQAKADLREQDRLVRIGQASQRQLTDADGKSQSLETAEQAHADLLESGAAYAMQAAPGKLGTWQQAVELKGLGVPDELRYVTGVDAERIAALQDDAKRQKVGIEDALSYSEKQAYQAVRDQARSSMPLVLVAEAVVLPVPEELRGDELFVDGVLEEDVE